MAHTPDCHEAFDKSTVIDDGDHEDNYTPDNEEDLCVDESAVTRNYDEDADPPVESPLNLDSDDSISHEEEI
jgi:hypothetical protein